MNFSVILFVLSVVTLASCQRVPITTYKEKIYDDGQYREENYRYRPAFYSNRYYNYNDGEEGSYRPEYSGQYRPIKYTGYPVQYRPKTVVTYTKPIIDINEGRYVHDNTGFYNNQDGRYVHDNSGAYKHETEKIVRVPTIAEPVINSKVIATKTTVIPAPKVVIPAAEPLVKTFVRAGGPVRDATQYYDNRHYAILRLENEQNLDGYNYAYETENGIAAQQEGKVENHGTDDEVLRTRGFYSYTGPDGVLYSVHYTADENGFVAHGDHLPKAPVVPETQRAVSFKRV